MNAKPTILVMVDMEGISGICRRSQIIHEMDYPNGRLYASWDVNACVEGCFRAGAGRVIVRDAHWQGFNLLWHELDERAEYIQGGVDMGRSVLMDQCQGVILLGYHGMAGSSQAVLEHTMSSASWQNFWINGRKSGEIAIEAAIAAEHRIPVLMVSGDDKACAEAKDFLPWVVTVQTKVGLGCQSALLLPKKRAHAAITEGAERAIKSIGKMKLYKVKKPVTLRLEVVERQQIPWLRPGVKIIDGRTYEVSGRSFEQTFNNL